MTDNVLVAYLKRLVSTWPPVPEPVVDTVVEILRSAGTGTVGSGGEPVPDKVPTRRPPGSPPPEAIARLHLMTYEEVGEAFGIGHRTVARMGEHGDLVRVAVGKRRYVTRDSFEALLERRRKEGVHEARKSRRWAEQRGKR